MHTEEYLILISTIYNTIMQISVNSLSPRSELAVKYFEFKSKDTESSYVATKIFFPHCIIALYSNIQQCNYTHILTTDTNLFMCVPQTFTTLGCA